LYGVGDFIEVSGRFKNLSVAMSTIGMPDVNSWSRKGVVCVLASFDKYKDLLNPRWLLGWLEGGNVRGQWLGFVTAVFSREGEKSRLVKKEWTAKCTVKRMELAPAQNSKERGLRDGKRDEKEGKE
jgi:hypothetical protein